MARSLVVLQNQLLWSLPITPARKQARHSFHSCISLPTDATLDHFTTRLRDSGNYLEKNWSSTSNNNVGQVLCRKIRFSCVGWPDFLCKIKYSFLENEEENLLTAVVMLYLLKQLKYCTIRSHEGSWKKGGQNRVTLIIKWAVTILFFLIFLVMLLFSAILLQFWCSLDFDVNDSGLVAGKKLSLFQSAAVSLNVLAWDICF